MPASLARSCLNNSINNLQYEHNVQNTEAGFQKGNRRIKMPALAEVCTDCPECLVLTADRSHHGPSHSTGTGRNSWSARRFCRRRDVVGVSLIISRRLLQPIGGDHGGYLWSWCALIGRLGHLQRVPASLTRCLLRHCATCSRTCVLAQLHGYQQ